MTTKTTKVYAVIGSYGYEGSDSPDAIFDNEKSAEKLRQKLIDMKRGYDDVRVVEYTLNEVPTYV